MPSLLASTRTLLELALEKDLRASAVSQSAWFAADTFGLLGCICQLWQKLMCRLTDADALIARLQFCLDGCRNDDRYLTEHAVVRVHPGSVNFSFKLLRDADREGPSAAIGDPHVNTRNWVRRFLSTMVQIWMLLYLPQRSIWCFVLQVVYFQRMVTSQDYLFDTTVVDGEFS